MPNKFSKETKLNLINGSLKSAKKSKQKKQKRIEEYDLYPTVCKKCNNSLEYSKRHYKFCSRSCAVSLNNLGVAKNFVTGNGAKKKCKFCDKITTNSKFCSHKCNKEFSWNERKKEIERTGKIIAPVTGKRYLQETRGDICEICKLVKWQEKDIVMIMDHIDGDASNNDIPNLRLICPNCDSQLPTYKGRNKGNGRHSRRKRYAEGKSY